MTWIDRGVLKELAYDAAYVQKHAERLGTNVPLSNPGAYRISVSGTETSVEDMIATTPRGLLVTRTGELAQLDRKSGLVSSVTQSGVWLIENGKIKFPVKNMRILESPFFVGNSIEQLGKPERIYGTYPLSEEIETSPVLAFGRWPTVVPAMKVRDFNFAGLADAV